MGTIPNPYGGNATSIDGVTVTGVPSTGEVITALTATTADWEAGGGGGGITPPAGDIGGTTSVPVIISINGTDTSNEFVVGTGSALELRTITSSDVPTLNQNTTGNAATATAADGLVSATTTVSVSTATAPSANQVLTATSSTAATWQTASTGFSNPMTTSGDIIYENATPVPARLAGNTTATKNFLTMTSAAPAWGTIATGDVPTLNQNTTGTAANVTGTVALVNGGTGQITAQLAMNALAGAVTSTDYLRGNGTNVVMSAIQAGDVPTLNQNTTGTATGGGTLTAYGAPAVVTLTDASTVTVNAALGNDFRLLMTSGVGSTRALGAPSNAVNGQKIIFQVTQDATGSQLLTYNAIYEFSTGLPSPTLSTAASAVDLLGFIYNSTKTKWLFVAFVPGF